MTSRQSGSAGRKPRVAVIWLAAVLACITPAHAALLGQGASTPDEIVLAAPEFLTLTFAQEGPEAALRVFESLNAEARAEPDIVLVAAIAMQRVGRSADAETLLRDALADHPDKARLRLEYARLLYERGRLGAADFQFRLALGASRVDGVERAAARRYLFEIEDSRLWRFSTNLALAPDSNINQATSSDTVDLFGLPFRLDEASRATSGVGVEAAISGERRFRLGVRRLTLSSGLRRREYEGKRFDDTLAVGGAALEFSRYEVSANYARRWVGDRRQLDVYGAALVREIDLSPRTRLGIEGSVRQIDQRIGRARDGRLYGFGLTLRRALESAGFLEGSADLRRFEAQSVAQSYWLGGGALTAYRDFPAGLGVLAEPTLSYRLHDAGDFFFPDPREDVSVGLRVRAVKRDRVVFGASPYVELAGERTWSNQTLYDTERIYGRLGLTRTF